MLLTYFFSLTFEQLYWCVCYQRLNTYKNTYRIKNNQKVQMTIATTQGKRELLAAPRFPPPFISRPCDSHFLAFLHSLPSLHASELCTLVLPITQMGSNFERSVQVAAWGLVAVLTASFCSPYRWWTSGCFPVWGYSSWFRF